MLFRPLSLRSRLLFLDFFRFSLFSLSPSLDRPRRRSRLLLRLERRGRFSGPSSAASPAASSSTPRPRDRLCSRLAALSRLRLRPRDREEECFFPLEPRRLRRLFRSSSRCQYPTRSCPQAVSVPLRSWRGPGWRARTASSASRSAVFTLETLSPPSRLALLLPLLLESSSEVSTCTREVRGEPAANGGLHAASCGLRAHLLVLVALGREMRPALEGHMSHCTALRRSHAANER